MIDKQRLYQISFLRRAKQSVMVLLFLLTLLISPQATADMPLQGYIGIAPIESEIVDGELLLTYRIETSVEAKDIGDISIDFEISADDSFNQIPPDNYPTQHKVTTQISDWKKIKRDSRYVYTHYKLTIPIKGIGKGISLITSDFTTIVDGKVSKSVLYIPIMVLDNKAVLGDGTLDAEKIAAGSALEYYIDITIMERYPELFKKKRKLRDEIISESRKESKGSYKSKKLESYKKELDDADLEEAIIRMTEAEEIRKDYRERFLKQQPQAKNLNSLSAGDWVTLNFTVNIDGGLIPLDNT